MTDVTEAPVTKITTEQKNAWIAALRSGEYTQGRGRLHSYVDGEDRYCVLGVLANIIDPEGWQEELGEEDNDPSPGKVWGDTLVTLPDGILGTENLMKLVSYNDDLDWTFEDMADFIEVSV
jgi:hypothetical protein